MTSNFTLVEPKGWEYDLHSVYSAYIGHFQLHGPNWYDRSWGHLFATFEAFLAFQWPVIVVTDQNTGRAHIVTRQNSIGAFVKMIKTRFGETLPVVDNMVLVTPFETSSRHLREVSDAITYRKLYSTLPAAVLSALKTRVKSGEHTTINELWAKRDKTFLAIDFEWSERNERSCLEWGYAVVRCGSLDAMNHWPPEPGRNYRMGHYIVSEYVDQVINKHCPTHPWEYAFAESQVVSKIKLPQIIQAVISSLASPDSETAPNTLVLVGHGIGGDLTKLEDMKIKLPHNTLIIDTASYERHLYNSGLRPALHDPKTGRARAPNMTLSLETLLRSLSLPSPASTPPATPLRPSRVLQSLPGCAMHNAGNDAFMTLLALQMLVDPSSVKALPSIKKGVIGRPGTAPVRMNSMMPGVMPMMRPVSAFMGPITPPPLINLAGTPSPLTPSRSSSYFFPLYNGSNGQLEEQQQQQQQQQPFVARVPGGGTARKEREREKLNNSRPREGRTLSGTLLSTAPSADGQEPQDARRPGHRRSHSVQALKIGGLNVG